MALTVDINKPFTENIQMS